MRAPVPRPALRPARRPGALAARRPGVLAALLALLAVPAAGLLRPPPLAAQDEIRQRIEESQGRLEQIRRERQELSREAGMLRGQIHDVSDEIRNIEARIGSTSSLLGELELQIAAFAEQVDITTRDMLATRDELAVRRAELRERLREIYRRGPLHAFQVLLQARSFGDLLSRYKYLHLVARYDRMLVAQVQRLEERLSEQRAQLASEYARLAALRLEKAREIDDLERLETQRQRRLSNVQARVSRTESRLGELEQEERRLGDLLVELERARREAERLAGTTSTSTLRTSDLGNLRWPVDGAVVYRFGDRRPDVADTWKGIGIGAPRGTPVRAVEAGEVAWAGTRGLLGQTVILDHGGGYWSGYLHLQDLAVELGQRVAAGAVIGRVGGDEASPEGTHIEFQIFEPDARGDPRQVDPVRWLRGRS
ncbi:MAG: peptidoglycan DD-metalloendopeptidase family protein [Gemmatimonadota bacterium]|nr:peptidoglycan DD-metalloendopeptidase family protein [Gemmatimonadota bacterium]